jgi:hypothetical protein
LPGRRFFHIPQLVIAEMEKRRSGQVVQITTSLCAMTKRVLATALGWIG